MSFLARRAEAFRAVVSPRLLRRAALPAAIVLLFLVHAGTFRYYTVEDAYISFRYARSLARGQGLTYNPGQRVEGFTDLLWVVVLAGVGALGGPIPLAAKLLGAAFGAACCLQVTVLARRLLGARSRLALLPPLLLAACPAVAFWSQAGLETAMFTLLLLLAVGPLLHVPAPDDRRAFLAGLGFGLALLARPETPLYLLAALLPLLLEGAAGRRAAVLALGAFLGVALPLELFRWSYFGDLLPNTYYVKSKRFQGGGWRYLGASLPHTGWGTLLAAALGALAGRGDRRTRTLLALVLLPGAYVVHQGGDWMPMGRFFVPLYPYLTLLAALGAATLARALQRPGARAVWSLTGAAGALLTAEALHMALLGQAHRRTPLGIAGLVALPLILLAGATLAALLERSARGAPGSRGRRSRALLTAVILPTLVISALSQRHDILRWEARLHEDWRLVGLWLREHAPPSATMATGLGGIIPWYAELPNHDNGGLMDREIARIIRNARDLDSERIAVDRYIMRRYAPTYFLLPNLVQLWPPGSAEKALAPWALAGDPEFRARYRLRTARIGDREFYFFQLRGPTAAEPRPEPLSSATPGRLRRP